MTTLQGASATGMTLRVGGGGQGPAGGPRPGSICPSCRGRRGSGAASGAPRAAGPSARFPREKGKPAGRNETPVWNSDAPLSDLHVGQPGLAAAATGRQWAMRRAGDQPRPGAGMTQIMMIASLMGPSRKSGSCGGGLGVR